MISLQPSAAEPFTVDGMDAQTSLKKCLVDAITEFFRDCGIESAPADEATPTRTESVTEVGSMVGFRGEQVHGGLALVAPRALVVATLPVPSDEARIDVQLRDWSGEMTNQLLGRLKNKLTACALDFEIGTPASFLATRFHFALQPAADGVASACLVSSTGARVFLDCSLRILPRKEDSHSQSLAEGEVIVF